MEGQNNRQLEQRIWEFASVDEQLVLDLMNAEGITRPIALVLAARGIARDKVHDFLHPDMANMGD
ncbi:MAG: hypothetical protein IJT83_11355, partial [Victivallales bacterium]|nr:hypothetical protein [Victivallales bacterium]